MNPTPDTTTAAGNGGNFDPRQAAALLDQTTQQTRRRLEPAQPWLLAIRAVVVLAVSARSGYRCAGSTPTSTRPPRSSPSWLCSWSLNFVATVAVARRATAGVSGKSRLRPAEITVFAVSGSACSWSWGRWPAPG